MAALSRSTAALRFFGDDLDPDVVSRLLESEPTAAFRKGEVSERGVVRRSGSWRRSASAAGPADLDRQIREILEPLSRDMAVWSDLTARYKADLFCGLFLTEPKEGLSLAPATLRMAAERNLVIDFDIYAADMTDAENGPSAGG